MAVSILYAHRVKKYEKIEKKKIFKIALKPSKMGVLRPGDVKKRFYHSFLTYIDSS